MPVWLQGEAEAGGLCAGLCGAARRGLSAQSGGPARGAAGGRAGRRAAALRRRRRSESGRAGSGGRTAGAGGGGAAAARQCLCPAGGRRRDRPAELALLRPERVSVASGADGWPSAYLYRAGGQAVRIASGRCAGAAAGGASEGAHPGDDHYGLGCLERRSARRACTTAPAAGTRRCSTMRRGRAGRWSTSRGTDRAWGEQFDRLKGAGASSFPERPMPGGRCCSRAG